MKNNRGFTIIELMVVVGIIGVISMIAIPNFQRFQAKAKQANAKTELTTIYGMEKAFFTEFGTYHENLGLIGYTPDGVPVDGSGCPMTPSATDLWPTRYYATGFDAPTTDPSPSSLGPFCEDNAFRSHFPAITNGSEVDTGSEPKNTTEANTADKSTFRVGSVGKIISRLKKDSTSGTNVAVEDQWQIDQNKQLKNVAIGF